MRVVDTSAWIEWIIGSPVGRSIERAIPAPEDWLVPTLVQLELAKWARRELGEARSRAVLAFSTTCVVEPLTTSIALAAADFAARHRLATADAIIYATTRLAGADLLTCDAHFDGLERVCYVAKTSS